MSDDRGNHPLIRWKSGDIYVSHPDADHLRVLMAAKAKGILNERTVYLNYARGDGSPLWVQIRLPPDLPSAKENHAAPLPTPQTLPVLPLILGTLLLPRKNREAVLGCIEERYQTRHLPRLGARAAKVVYWRDVFGAVVWGWLSGGLRFADRVMRVLSRIG